MNTILDQLKEAQAYAYEQAHNLELDQTNRMLYAADEVHLSAHIKLIYDQFGVPDSEHWFWRGDYLE